MTTSTAPITLPARHRRQEAPQWWFHTLVAWTLYAAALVLFNIRSIAHTRGLRHVIGLALATAVPTTAAALLIALAAGLLQ